MTSCTPVFLSSCTPALLYSCLPEPLLCRMFGGVAARAQGNTCTILLLLSSPTTVQHSYVSTAASNLAKIKDLVDAEVGEVHHVSPDPALQ